MGTRRMPGQRARNTRKRASNPRRGAKRIQKKPKQRGKSLLILECDADKLSTQSVSMADEIRTVAQLFAPKVKIDVVKATTEESLKSRFAQLAEDDCRFGIIAVIGHSSTSGLNLTSDRDVSWAVFAKWVELFEPKQMALVACQSGHVLPVRDLFIGIPTLKEVYASPVNTTKPQSEIINILIPYLLNTRSADSELIQLGQFFNLLFTGGIIFRWLRKEFQLLPNAR